MRWFWESAIRPLLQASKPTTVIEIGADDGATTVPLLELAAEIGADVHVIDPAPRFDPLGLDGRLTDRLRLHRARSLEVLPEVGTADAVLIDGDHNWYTVFNELKTLEATAAAADSAFPLTFLHDVSWPYARRDMYYDPDSIPERWRQPWDRRPIVWGQSELGREGLNGDFANALVEGTPRNGVLTGLEDFCKESDLPLEQHLIEGSAGLAILAPTATLEQSPELRREWGRLDSPEFLRAHIHRLAALLAATAR